MKNNKGFSLVELIVVIAIMAILAAVAVIGVSVYIPKAQQSSDEQLISDIEYALTLASYDGTSMVLGDGGYIVLTTSGVSNADDIKANNPKLAQVLANAYGEQWPTEMKLAYDEWGNSGLTNGLAGAMAGAVKNSSYMAGNRTDALLGDVEKMTGMAQNLVTALSSNPNLAGTTLSELFTADVLNATGLKYGVGDGTWTADQWDAWGAENEVAYGNLLVLAAADDVENNKSNMSECSAATSLIMNFSSYYAFAATNPEFSDVLDERLESLQEVSDVSTGKAWFESLEEAANEAGYQMYRYDVDENGVKTDSDQYKTDYIAFGTVMSSLGNPTNEQAAIISGDLNNANMFTSGIGNSLYNDYLDAVDAVSSIFGDEDMSGLTVPEGGVAILYIMTENGIVLTNTLPIQ